MSMFDIDVNDFIRFLEESGATIVDGDEGLIIAGEAADPVEALREAFSTPIEVEERSFFVPPVTDAGTSRVDVKPHREYPVLDSFNLVA